MEEQLWWRMLLVYIIIYSTVVFNVTLQFFSIFPTYDPQQAKRNLHFIIVIYIESHIHFNAHNSYKFTFYFISGISMWRNMGWMESQSCCTYFLSVHLGHKLYIWWWKLKGLHVSELKLKKVGIRWGKYITMILVTH